MNVPGQTRRNTLILTFIVLLLSWGVVYLFLEYQLKNSINEQFQRVVGSAQKFFDINLKHDKAELDVKLDEIVMAEGLAKAIANRDYEQIKSIVSPLYSQLKSTHNAVDILTFRSPDGITLFRAHKPNYFGDMLNKKRTLMVDTNTLHRSFSGFEAGNLEMTYRITKPIFYNDIYVGNVELGVSPEGFLKNLNSIFKTDLGVSIDKSLFDIMLEKKAIPINEKYLFVSGSDNLKAHFKHKHSDESELYKIDMSIPLENHLSQILGYLVVGFEMSDIAKKDTEFMHRLFFMIVVIMLIFGAIHHFGFNKMLKYFSKQVYTDHLTGLLNRHALNDALFSEHKKLLILSNIKEFSLINELYGVDVGNEILVEVAETFRSFA
ncbi:MAG: cache domain-containing protein, partial [Sulfurimonas sp.]|nr:cache domain-containing protein [Sulfurimonas sp.]